MCKNFETRASGRYFNGMEWNTIDRSDDMDDDNIDSHQTVKPVK